MSAAGRVDNWQSVLTNTEDSRRDYPADNANPHYITFQYMKLQHVTALVSEPKAVLSRRIMISHFLVQSVYSLHFKIYTHFLSSWLLFDEIILFMCAIDTVFNFTCRLRKGIQLNFTFYRHEF